jgi:hypothetical protein
LMDGETLQGFTLKEDIARKVRISGEPHDGVGQGGFSGPVGTHHCMHVSRPELKRQMVEYTFSFKRRIYPKIRCGILVLPDCAESILELNIYLEPSECGLTATLK